ncbi:MAG: twin-arginine translocation signal domain-containing protein [Anaerolineales bacterium]|nr:twin-arginine translocation signal domain-containing protein [Anaerolineales bacterium]
MDVSRRQFLKMAGVGVSGLALAAAQPAPASAETTPEEAAEQPAMLYDTTLCVGCRACQTACRNWNETIPERDELGFDRPADLSGQTWTLIKLYQDEAADAPNDRANWSFVKRNCMHCLDPACVSACTVGALQKTAEGPIIYDVNRCFGCRYCMVACPYHCPATSGTPPFPWSRSVLFASVTFSLAAKPTQKTGWPRSCSPTVLNPARPAR